MEFVVFTAAGGLREFVGDSTYEVGAHNGCLTVVDGPTGKRFVYGVNGWASVQEKQIVEIDEGVTAGPTPEAEPEHEPAPDLDGELEAPSEDELLQVREVLAALEELPASDASVPAKATVSNLSALFARQPR